MKTDQGTLLAIAWRDKPRQPMHTAPAAMISVETGVGADFRGGPGRRQVTVLREEDWQAACAALGQALPWTLRRANLLVRGVGNPLAAGGVLTIGVVSLAITGECDPCSRMDAQHPGLRAALAPDWRGGFLAQVIRGGRVEEGDRVAWA